MEPFDRDRELRRDLDAEPLEELDEARITRSEEELAVGKRELSAGEVEIDKHVETEHVSEPVRVRREEVEIERRPVSELNAGDARIQEEHIRVPLSEEEVIAEKRVVPREELVVRKRDVQDTKLVETDLRREEIDVEEDGGLDDRRML